MGEGGGTGTLQVGKRYTNLSSGRRGSINPISRGKGCMNPTNWGMGEPFKWEEGRTLQLGE